jgi:hypothetical protein
MSVSEGGNPNSINFVVSGEEIEKDPPQDLSDVKSDGHG